MATLYSDQMTKLVANVPRESIKYSESGGRVRLMSWTFLTPAGGVAINDVVLLGVLPKGARTLEGIEYHEAMSTGAGAAAVEIGIYTPETVVVEDVDYFLAATSVDAAGQTAIGNTLALFSLTELAGIKWVGAKATVEAWAAAKKFYGYLLYVDGS